MISIAACITVHNRCELTLRCLSSLQLNAEGLAIRLDIILVDDGSTDGTAEAVQALYPSVRLLKGDGSLFWAGGMRKAYGEAMRLGYDYYLWLNDDVELYPNAIERALGSYQWIVSQYGGHNIVVGAVQSPEDGATSYSGFVRASNLLPWRLKRQDPDLKEVRECATVNGNFVLVPDEVARATGPINAAYAHTLADLDLGFKVSKIGGKNWILPGYVGTCAPNISGRNDFGGPDLTVKERLKLLEHPLGFPFRANAAYAKHFGILAPIVIMLPYIRIAKIVVRNAIKGLWPF